MARNGSSIRGPGVRLLFRLDAVRTDPIDLARLLWVVLEPPRVYPSDSRQTPRVLDRKREMMVLGSSYGRARDHRLVRVPASRDQAGRAERRARAARHAIACQCDRR